LSMPFLASLGSPKKTDTFAVYYWAGVFRGKRKREAASDQEGGGGVCAQAWRKKMEIEGAPWLLCLLFVLG